MVEVAEVAVIDVVVIPVTVAAETLDIEAAAWSAVASALSNADKEASACGARH